MLSTGRKCPEEGGVDAGAELLKLRQNLNKRQVILRQPEVSDLQMLGLKENKYVTKPRSILLPGATVSTPTYSGIVGPQGPLQPQVRPR